MVDERNDTQPRRTHNLLVYGIEKKGLRAPAEPIKRANYSLTFESFETPRRFNEFDGVILFQGIFEKVERHSSYHGSTTSITCDKHQLDKRHNELDLLLEKRGFVCFILCREFVDDANFGDDPGFSDLAKRFLLYRHFYRKNFSDRILWVANWQLRRHGQLIKSTTVRLPAIRTNVSAPPFAVVAHLGGCLATERAVNSAFVVIIAKRTQLALQVQRVPEQRLVEQLSAYRSD